MEDDFRNRPRGFTYGFGNFGDNRKFGFNGNDEFFNSFFHHDLDQMFHDMENFMNNIGFPIISNIQYIENPQIDEPNYGEFNQNKKENLRNMFLKSPGEDNTETQFVSNDSNDHQYWVNDLISKPNDVNNDQNEQSKNINKFFKRDITENNINLKPVYTTPTIITTGQSCIIKRIQRPDGSIEETKTIRNSDGIEEKTVTRIIGDKVHSVIEKKSPTGVDETEEIFQNFDQEKIGEFNKMWENFSFSNKTSENSNLYDRQENQTQNSGLMSKIFSWFK